MKRHWSFNSGYFDGRNSATFQNPIHNNWRRDHNDKVTHFDAAYLAGYIKGFVEVACHRPECFP